MATAAAAAADADARAKTPASSARRAPPKSILKSAGGKKTPDRRALTPSNGASGAAVVAGKTPATTRSAAKKATTTTTTTTPAEDPEATWAAAETARRRTRTPRAASGSGRKTPVTYGRRAKTPATTTSPEEEEETGAGAGTEDVDMMDVDAPEPEAKAPTPETATSTKKKSTAKKKKVVIMLTPPVEATTTTTKTTTPVGTRSSPRRAAAAKAAAAIAATAKTPRAAATAASTTPTTTTTTSATKSSITPMTIAPAVSTSSSKTPRASPRLAAMAAAGGGGGVALGPVRGDAATKTPSRLASSSTTKTSTSTTTTTEEEAGPLVEPPLPVLAPRPRRKGLTGGGAVRVLVDPSRVPGAAAAEPEHSPQPMMEATMETAEETSPEEEEEEGPEPARKRPREIAEAPPPACVPKKSVVARSSASARTAGPGPRVKPITVPKSPAISKPNKRARVGKTTEELAFEKAQAEGAAEKRAMALAAKRAARASGRGGGRVRPKPLTRPVAPALSSRTHAMTTRTQGTGEEASPYKSIAERCHGFTTKSLRGVDEARGGAGAGAATTSRGQAKERPLTRPVSPAITRAIRARGPPQKSSEELELEQIAARKKFKARPLKRSVLLGAGDAAAKTAAAAAAKLAAKERADADRARGPMAKTLGRTRGAEKEAEEAEMKTRDAKRRKACEEENGGWNACAPATVPESPNLTTSRRAVRWGAVNQLACEAQAAPSAEPSSRKTNKRWTGELTAFEPFDLCTEKRGAYAERVLERTVAEEEARAAERRRFEATPAPPSTLKAPRPSTRAFEAQKPLTTFQPFNLRGEALHEYEKRRESARRADEDAAAKAKTEFHARAIPTTHFNPMFELEASATPLTTPMENVARNAETRAKSRAAFDEKMARKHAEEEREREAKKAAEAEEEARLRAEFRKSTVFVARPMPDYGELAGVGVGPTEERALTFPQSPTFVSKRRAAAEREAAMKARRGGSLLRSGAGRVLI